MLLLLLLLLDISQCESKNGELFCTVEQQPLQYKPDSHHQNYPSDTKMTQNQAYNTHIFDSGQQQQGLDDTKITANLAYGVCTSGFDGQQQPSQNDLNHEQGTAYSARNVVHFQSHLPSQQDGVTDAQITSNPAYGVVHQQEHGPTLKEKIPKS